MVEASERFDINLRAHSMKGNKHIFTEKIIGGFYWEVFCEVTQQDLEIVCSPFGDVEEEGSAEWSCSVLVDIQFFNQEKSRSIYHKVVESLNRTNDTIMWKEMSLGWTFLVVDITVLTPESRLVGPVDLNELNVDEKSDEMNICFIIDGKEVYGNQQYLKTHSTVFKEMFDSERAELDQRKVIVTSPFTHKDFRKMVRLIHPTSESVTKYNFMRMAEIAHFYGVRSIIDKIERFLIYKAADEVTNVEKWVFAEKYDRIHLERSCLSEVKKAEKMDVLGMIKNPIFEILSTKSKLAVYQKLAEISIAEDKKNVITTLSDDDLPE